MKRSAAYLTGLFGLSLLAGCAGRFAVDAELPAGNVVVTKIADGMVHLRPDQRDTDGYWFYWKFRVTGAAGRTLSFRFPHPVVGSRGPAVSTDRGKTWAWGDDLQAAPLDPQTKDHADAQGFDWTFGEADDEVWFCQTLPYDPSDWRAFLDRHAADRGRLFEEGVLCTSRKGNPVPYARFGRLDGKAKERIFLSSRHHCGEVTATIVLEGFLEQVFADDELGRWLREDVELRVVPFADYEGVLAGDQGKNRKPHDYARDYNDDRPVLYPEVRAVMDMLRDWKPTVVTDIHCPWLRGSWFRENDSNEFIYQVGIDDPATTANQGRLAAILERTQRAGLDYRAADDYWFGRGWNSGANYAKGRTLIQWSVGALSGLKLATSWEIPFANARFRTLCPADFRAFGRDMADAYWVYLCGACVDGIYPHLAMTNDEGECGTGAVVPWAGSLWAVTYGPHCPVGSSDKLYQVTPDMRQVVRAESVGGTHADRMIHRETNQLLIGPYVIDAKGGVRVVPTAAMPGRLTGVARHLRDPAEKVYVATMETGLYELDLRTLAVNTLIRENGKNDWPISNLLDHVGADWPAGWRTAPQTRVPGYHAKGLCTGFGRVFVANNGEDSEEARRNPFVPSGVLAWWNEAGRDWTTIRRCQFTEIATRDGIYGNEHPDRNPVWSLGWDAKSVILAMTTNGTAWTHYRLPKASHCYDGAHGWNTEWPRIRDVGFGDGTLLATMHGTFWKLPADFSPARPDGIRPLSTYLKVIGDFCRWRDRLVFGCDDQAKNEFLGTRTLKKGAPKRDRSQSNLWFVKPEDLTAFGPPSGEGWVWFDEDVKKGDVSDPFLWAGYEDRRFSFTDVAGESVPHELLHEGDWVRVRALTDAKGAKAHFRYGPKRPATLPSYDGFIEVYDDHSKKTYRFPNVNGDKTVICREVATERDLLYAGGVFYEVPADNAGGFEVLRPIALASEPVRSIEARLGLVFINGKPQALDSLWKNGTAAAAYWLWTMSRFARNEMTPDVVRKLVLIGGYGDWENGQIVAFAEKKDPVVLTFSAASGDEPKYCEVLRGRFLKYTPNVESVTLVPNPPADELPGIRRKILAADILYFSGGATEELVKTIIHNHLGDTIRIAYRRGTVLSGFSAGSMLFVHAGFTDYPKKRYDLVEGLNIIPCFFGPHYQGRQWKAFDARLAEETDPSLPSEAWALEDGVSLFFRDEVPEVRRHLPDSHVWHFTRDAQGVWQKEDATHWNDAPVVETDPARTASAWRLCEGVLCEVDAQGAPVADGWRFAAKGTAEAIELGPVVRPGTGGALDFSSQPIVRVADAAFLNGGTNGMTSVKLPPSLREIGNWAFQNVTSLKSVDFGTDSQLVSFGNAAFKGCTALSEVKPLLPEGVADMWDVFENCPLTGTLRLGFGAAKEFALLHSSFRNHRLSAIELGPKVVELDHWVFMSDGNTTLTNVTVRGTLRRVGQNVFRGCTALPPECDLKKTAPAH